MKKIAIFTNSIYTVGGEQRVTCLLANELSKKYDVTLFTMDSPKNTNNIFEISDKIAIRYFRPYKYDLISFVFRAATHLTPFVVYDLFRCMLERAYCSDKYARLMAKLIGEEYDTVIVTAWQLSILLGKVKKYYYPNINAIAWEHNSYEAYFEKKYFYLYKNEALFVDNVKYVDTIAVLNDDYKNKYEDRLGLKSVVMYNPKSFASDKKCDLRNKTFLVCSRMDEFQKGIDLLFESFGEFSKNNKEWKLIVAGDGSALEKYRNKIVSSGYSERVQFLGRISDVKELMLNSSVLLLPSRFEGFPMSVTEAFEVGLPVLAYDIPAMIPFRHAGGAVTVPCFDTVSFAEQMGIICSDYELRKSMGEHGVDFAKTLDIEEIAKKWDELL